MYTNDEIDYFTSILKQYNIYKAVKETKPKHFHERCKHLKTEINKGAPYCICCGLQLQRILNYVELSDWDRCNYKKKSVYYRSVIFKISEVKPKPFVTSLLLFIIKTMFFLIFIFFSTFN